MKKCSLITFFSFAVILSSFLLCSFASRKLQDVHINAFNLKSKQDTTPYSSVAINLYAIGIVSPKYTAEQNSTNLNNYINSLPEPAQ